MPTITTTVTSAAGSGIVTTQTTTEATPEPKKPVTTTTPADAGVVDGPPKVRPPFAEEDITPAWLTAALHEGGHLHPSVNVASLEPLVNIGEGRGYANYSWKVVCTFDQPVSPDTPTQFVLKQMNQALAASWMEGKPRVLCDKSYVLECKWYEEIRDLLPVAQPKLYWSGFESPANPAMDFGVYCVLMEYLGDDLKKAETEDGISEEECEQAMEAIAKIHARFWNSEFLENWDAAFTMEEAMFLILGFCGGTPETEPQVAYDFATNVLGTDPALGAKFGAHCKAALKNHAQWYWKSRHSTGNKTLCTWDLRTDNMVWRKLPGGADKYEAVVLDQQIWCYTDAPMRDIACFFSCSATPEQMEDRVGRGLKKYHDTLVAEGVSTYTWEQCNADFNDAVWHPVCMSCFGGKIANDMDDTMETSEPGSTAYEEAKTMKHNIITMFNQIATRAKTLVELRDAYATRPFDLCPEDAAFSSKK